MTVIQDSTSAPKQSVAHAIHEAIHKDPDLWGRLSASEKKPYIKAAKAAIKTYMKKVKSKLGVRFIM